MPRQFPIERDLRYIDRAVRDATIRDLDAHLVRECRSLAWHSPPLDFLDLETVFSSGNMVAVGRAAVEIDAMRRAVAAAVAPHCFIATSAPHGKRTRARGGRKAKHFFSLRRTTPSDPLVHGLRGIPGHRRDDGPIRVLPNGRYLIGMIGSVLVEIGRCSRIGGPRLASVPTTQPGQFRQRPTDVLYCWQCKPLKLRV